MSDKCDFCSESNPGWMYPARTYQVQAFNTEDLKMTSHDEWAACEGCHQLIQADKWRELAERAKKSMGPEYTSVPLAVFEAVHREFKANWIGPPQKRA